MPRTAAADDLALLRQIAQEIRLYGFPQLPGSLRALLKTKSARVVADALEQVARQNLDKKSEVARSRTAADHLRDDMQLTTDALLSEENRRRLG